jgi:hypothetical protein
MPPRKIKQSEDATIQLKVSFKEDLRLKIIDAAEKAHRSMTAEVIYRLEKTFDRDGLMKLMEELGAPSTEDILSSLLSNEQASAERPSTRRAKQGLPQHWAARNLATPAEERLSAATEERFAAIEALQKELWERMQSLPQAIKEIVEKSTPKKK